MFWPVREGAAFLASINCCLATFKSELVVNLRSSLLFLADE